ncbi:MAG: phospho-N-acetylmuramoyl-pentapeptide-transferase, partial [Bacillota bacterium]|nr:phospho-N-acetylmuramoyl-pentapeptide-transferase [Bacillota bacterium]
PVLHRLKFGQYIKGDAPKSHEKKSGVPTMGGLIFILSSIITLILVRKYCNFHVYICFLSLISFGAIGLLDDGLKIFHKNNKGLSMGQKMLLIIAVSLFFSYYGYTNPSIGTSLLIPFTKTFLNLGPLYIPFTIFFYAAVTNAVNFTDGLDGLCTSVTIIVLTFFLLVSFAFGSYSISVFCGILVGALLGFLTHNSFPAKVIMGDTGALALGGAVTTVALILKLDFFILIVGGIYAIEMLSDVIQIVFFKLTGKRVFKMAPLHHSFELSGWHESKIVTMFSIITAILCMIGLYAI